MNLNNKFWLYLIAIISLSNLFKINTNNIILSNESDADFVVNVKHKPNNANIPTIITETLLASDSEVALNFDLSNEFQLVNNQARLNEKITFSLEEINIKYKDSIASESIVGQTIGGYKVNLPITEINDILVKNGDDIYIDLYKTSVTKGIAFRINNDKNYELTKIEERDSRLLHYIEISNANPVKVLLKLDILDKYKFNQIKRNKLITLEANETIRIPLLKNEDDHRTLVTEIYAHLMLEKDQEEMPGSEIEHMITSVETANKILDEEKQNPGTYTEKELKEALKTKEEFEEQLAFIPEESKQKEPREKEQESEVKKTISINIPLPTEASNNDEYKNLEFTPINIKKLTISNNTIHKEVYIQLKMTQGESYTPIGKLLGKATGYYLKPPKVVINKYSVIYF